MVIPIFFALRQYTISPVNNTNVSDVIQNIHQNASEGRKAKVFMQLNSNKNAFQSKAYHPRNT